MFICLSIYEVKNLQNLNNIFYNLIWMINIYSIVYKIKIL
jgi:hypothetical protein